MNLTYEVRGNGYVIKLDGKDWVVQDDYIPFPGATVEESAQNHIDVIIADSEAPAPVNEIEKLEQKIDNAILELTTLIAMGDMQNV